MVRHLQDTLPLSLLLLLLLCTSISAAAPPYLQLCAPSNTCSSYAPWRGGSVLSGRACSARPASCRAVVRAATAARSSANSTKQKGRSTVGAWRTLRICVRHPHEARILGQQGVCLLRQGGGEVPVGRWVCYLQAAQCRGAAEAHSACNHDAVTADLVM
jgi:hypothetical protein